MKIKSIRIENFRGFHDVTIMLNRYSCFVGQNGAGKSTVLAALNLFFRDTSWNSDVGKIFDEDYFEKNTSVPVRVTLTFDDINEAAGIELADYVRQEELIVTAEAIFDSDSQVGQVRYYGQRLGMEEFRGFFEAEKRGARAAELAGIFDEIRTQFPALPNPRSKDEKAQALRDYEDSHPELCSLIRSEDNFYGINGSGKLVPYIQWIYVPAVKDMVQEGQESRNTALGKLISRAVESRSSFLADIEQLRRDTLVKYDELLSQNEENLKEVSQALLKRLEEWAHPDVKLGMQWVYEPSKAVVLQTPVAGIKAGEGDFLGNLARMGHGFQRSYFLALLQELAGADLPGAPTLVLGCEEPELYQHPPQARHMADVFTELAAKGNNQILVTTHSPLFVSGDGFENVRIFRKQGPHQGSSVHFATFDRLVSRIREATQDDQHRPIRGMVAKIHQALQPSISEMFFARVSVLVEGLEDVAYLTTQLHLDERWEDFRRLGCHIVPVNGKDKLIQPLAMANELNLPVFTIFDADGDTIKEEHRIKHEKDNRALMNVLDIDDPAPFPSGVIWGPNYVVWPTNLTKMVRNDFDSVQYERITNRVRQSYAQEGGLEKNHHFIADWVTQAYQEGLRSPTLERLCEQILQFAAPS